MSLQHWENYYRGGLLATCPTGREGSYDLELRQVWVDLFAPLPDGAAILDVATGNGAIALIARETAVELDRDWRIHAADLARIDPPRFVANGPERFAGIEFAAGVPMERMPYEDAAFDAVSGQFALEYADTVAALREIARVLKPGGVAQFVLHHADSVLVRNGRWSLGQADFLVKKAKIYRRLRRVVTGEQMAPDAARHAAAQLQQSIRMVKAVMQEARQVGGALVLEVTLDAVHKLLTARTQMRAIEIEPEVARAEGELRASVRRLNDLVDHALDQAAIDRLQQQARDAGFDAVQVEPQHHGGSNLVGWRMQLRRA